MNKKIMTILLTACLVVFIAGVSLVMLAAGYTKEVTTDTDEPVNRQGNVYYVDASAKSEQYDGTSPKRPLKTLAQVNELELGPGDTVLFKKDCQWIGSLRIKHSGTEEKPIVFGMYGKGENKPRIDGEGIVNATVWGEDVSFIEIRNLEVTNTGDETNYHRGISVVAVHENVEGIVIKDCYVHDVDSCVEVVETNVASGFTDYHWYGGIIVRARSNANPVDYDIILKDILIEGNTVERCSVLGIAAGGAMTSWEKDKKCEEIVIRGNHVSKCYGDGIVLFNDEGGLIEHNVAAYNGMQTRMDRAYVGIWIIWSNNCLIQYNESYGQGASVDGEGFDIDGGCKGTIVQYNYSHDNAGGFLLLVQWAGGDAIVRYNVSVNDGRSLIFHSFGNYAEPRMRVDVYNNTLFTTKSLNAALDVDINSGFPKSDYAYYRNNIFCVKNGTSATFVSPEVADLFGFENNLYYGFSDSTIPWLTEEEILTEDPMFTFVGSAGIGFDSLDGYKLLSSSPCLERGIKIFNHGGLDFWGNKVEETSSWNIGAYMGGAAKRPAGVNIASLQETDISSFDGIPMLRNQHAARLVDGKTDEFVSTQHSDTANKEEWFEVELGDTYDISKVVLAPTEDGSGYPVNFCVDVCDADGEWVEVFAKKNCKKPKNGEPQTYTFDKVSGEKLRIRVTKLRETDGNYYAALSEIEVY